MSFARVRGPGQPDQICDLVVAGIVEEYLRRDPQSRLNIRATGGRGVLFLAGDLLSSADFDVSSVVKRIVANGGQTSAIEPFIAFEQMLPGWGPVVGAREPISVMGYATNETEELIPRSVAVAREVARELERRRVLDEQWYWLGSDYEVAVEQLGKGKPTIILIRAEHLEAKSLVEVRKEIAAVIQVRLQNVEASLHLKLDQMDIRVNVTGEEVQAGLKARMGSSGRTGAAEQYGTLLPATASGAGVHLTHPLNAGAWLCRRMARECVEQDKGKAVMIQATWYPFDAKPSTIRIRNERGEDISSGVDLERFDLSRLPSEYLVSSLTTSAVRLPFESAVVLPWEHKM